MGVIRQRTPALQSEASQSHSLLVRCAGLTPHSRYCGLCCTSRSHMAAHRLYPTMPSLESHKQRQIPMRPRQVLNVQETSMINTELRPTSPLVLWSLTTPASND